MRTPPTSPDVDLSFTTLGRYEVLARVGRGNRGAIYLSRQAGPYGFQRLLDLRMIADGAGMPSLVREAQIGGLLNHPNVLRIVDVGRHENRPFVVVEHVEGTSLARLLATAPPPPAAVVVSIVLDVLRGLHAAHDLTDATGKPLGIVHCDLAPENILVGLDGVARIDGFGDTRLTGEAERDEQGAALGTPGFRAPEQLRGDPVDRRADLFVAGAVLWTALTGHPLFVDRSYGQTIVNVLHQQVEPPSAYGAPAVLDEVCRKALARAPQARYQSAEEMRQALHAAAFRGGLLASGSAIGAWVERVAGKELAQGRRLAPPAPPEERMVAVRRRTRPAPARGPWLAIATAALLAVAGVLVTHHAGGRRPPLLEMIR